MAADGRKTIAVDAALHALWAAEAKRQGVALSTYVSVAVERLRTGEVAPVMPAPITVRPITSTTVNPKDCTNRLSPGTWCRRCGTTHGRKA